MMQFEFGRFEQAQPLLNTNTRSKSSLLETTIPRVPMPIVRTPRVTVTSTTNTLINATPRMSSVVIRTQIQLQPPISVAQTNPLVNPLQEEIGNIVYDFHKQRYISTSLSNIQAQNTNPFLTEPVQKHNLITTPSTSVGQTTLPLTLPTQTVTHTNVNPTNTTPQEPNVGNLFEDADGNPDYKALLIHFKAQAQQAQTQLSKPTTHKMNYGRVPPPILNLDNELKSTTYQMWKES